MYSTSVLFLLSITIGLALDNLAPREINMADALKVGNVAEWLEYNELTRHLRCNKLNNHHLFANLSSGFVCLKQCFLCDF